MTIHPVDGLQALGIAIETMFGPFVVGDDHGRVLVEVLHASFSQWIWRGASIVLFGLIQVLVANLPIIS